MPPLDSPAPTLWTTTIGQLAVSADGQQACYRNALHTDTPWVLLDRRATQPTAPDHRDRARADAVTRQLDLLAPVVDRFAGLTLIRHHRRSASRVRDVALLPWCPACIDGDAVEADANAGLYALPGADDGDLQAVSVLCADHVRLTDPDRRTLPLAQLSAAVGAPVGWASAADVAASHPLIARRRWSGPARGPLLADRTVVELRMGQTGYVPAHALRLDGQRRLLLVDLDAPAPQHATGACVVPVRRTVRLGYEAFVGIDHAERYDLAWSQYGPPVAGRNEVKVTEIRGLWATPLLAARLGHSTAAPASVEGPARTSR